MSILFLYIVHHIVLALGLASSLVVDVFLIMVEKTKKIRGIEKRIIDRVMSYTFLFSVSIFFIQLMYFFYIFINQENFSDTTYFFSAITFLISSLLLFSVTTQKYYQLKILERYQEQHAHLSDSFINHHKEIRRTAALSLILWILLYASFLLI
jgi:hypothetical protein